MKNWALTLVDAPDTEPVTLEQLKLQAHITYDIQDSVLNSYLLAGRLKAEEYQRQSYITQTWRLTLDCVPNIPINLLRGPVQSVSSVKVYDENDAEYNVDISNFSIDTDHVPAKMVLKPSGSWPSITYREFGAVKIDYICGYGNDGSDVPETAKHAIILFAAFQDDNRAADEENIPNSFFNLLQPTRIETNEPY